MDPAISRSRSPWGSPFCSAEIAEPRGHRGLPLKWNPGTGSYTFAGGTGRFAKASGSAGFEAGTADGVHVVITFEDTLLYKP